MMENSVTELNLDDTSHRCIMCNAEAFEYEDNTYKCSDPGCEFTWKVMISE